MFKRDYDTAAAITALVIIGGLLIGWIANIVKIVGSDFGHITGMLVVRVIGIFVAPLGAILGFF